MLIPYRRFGTIYLSHIQEPSSPRRRRRRRRRTRTRTRTRTAWLL